MSLIGNETKELMQDLYKIASIQETLDKDDLTMVINWASLRKRLEESLIENSIEIPKLQ